jgi:glutamate synthase (NADPH/NADH) large chain
MEQDHGLAEKADHEVIEAARPAIEDGERVEISRRVTNRNRTFGTLLSSAITAEHGEAGLEDGAITLDLEGSGGQSFGAFATSGITFQLDGDANDYCGKGLSGAKLVVRTPDSAGYAAEDNVVVGNVALYGATDGEAYFNGKAGERFAVRNSGVKTVVEGVGDHGCEYMTGGVAVVLGETGKNFAAGMSGGEAYVLDVDGDFRDRVNRDMVHFEPMDDRDREMVRRMVENHYRYTDSEVAAAVLDDWEQSLDRFVKVMPDAFADVVEDHLARGEDLRASPPPEPAAPETATGDD